MSIDFLGWGRAMLDRWIVAQGLTLISAETCWFNKGPYSFWGSSRNQVVIRFKVRDDAGVEKSGYARCGGSWWGTLTDAVDVTWDSQGISSQ
jgi:hypothetical protein